MINLVEKLKNAPKGTKLYCTLFGEVEFESVLDYTNYPIVFKITDGTQHVTLDGRYFDDYKGECVLFPSKENRDWSTFSVESLKFDLSELKPFDKVLVRGSDASNWNADLFSHIDTNFVCVGSGWSQCIPYNDETEHLVGTTNDCPDYYKTW